MIIYGAGNERPANRVSERRGVPMTRRILRSLIFLALAAGALGPAQGQSTRGLLHGLVRGRDLKPLAGAAVTLNGSAMQGQRLYLTPETGLFRFSELPQGVYDVRAEVPGFKSVVRTGIRLSVGRTVDLVIELEPSTLEDEAVDATPVPNVDVSSSKLSLVYGRTLLAALPLARDFGALLRLVPGSVGEGPVMDRAAAVLGASSWTAATRATAPPRCPC
jgi:hypothetical protein